MALHAVLFDLDGTLVDSAPTIAAALSGVRKARGFAAVAAESVRPWISLGAPELVRRGLGAASEHPEGDLLAFRRILASTPASTDCLYPGVPELLTGLNAAALDLAIVTNKPESLARTLLQTLNLDAAFGVIVGGDSVEASKPDPAPSLAALRALGRDLAEAAFVGDSLIDAQAAAALDLPFHLFEGGYGAVECCGMPTASRFTSHLALLETLVRPGSAARAEASA